MQKKELNLECKDCNKSLEDCTCIEDTIDMNYIDSFSVTKSEFETFRDLNKQETLEEHYLSVPKPLVDVSRMKVDNHPDIDNKETLEEVAERLVKKTTLYGSQTASIGSSARSYFETELRCVLLGMQWQKEQDKKMYSEEEVKEAYAMGRLNKSIKNFNKRFNLKI